MTRLPGAHQGCHLILLVAIVCTACTATPITPPTRGKGGGTPAAATDKTPADDSVLEATGKTPAKVGPIGSTPATTPSSTISSAVTPAANPLAGLVMAKLATVAQASFVQARSELISNNSGGIVSGNSGNLISNHSAGLISNNSGGLISNNSGGLISNNSGGLISNNSGGLISNNSGGYHTLALDGEGGATLLAAVAAVAPTMPLDADGNPTIPTHAIGNELVFADRHWPSGARTLTLALDLTDLPAYARTITFDPAGQPRDQFISRRTSAWSNGHPHTVEQTTVRLAADGKFEGTFASTTSYADNGNIQSVAVNPDSGHFRSAELNVELDVAAFSVDLTPHTGTFKYAFPNLKLTETGTLANVQPLANGTIGLSFGDPLAHYEGESKVEDADGKLIFTKKHEILGGQNLRSYDLQDGIGISLVEDDKGEQRGTMTQEGKEVAKVWREAQANGSTIFHVTFPDKPNETFVTGYGITDPAPTESPAPAAPLLSYDVATLAGSLTAGDVTGANGAARFGALGQIVASRVTQNRFYVADTGNHRIKQLDWQANGDIVVKNFAGSGADGHQDGAAGTATFKSPFGLAIGADDTLYVADGGADNIRKVAADGTVTTVAGDGTTGKKDGPALESNFDGPTGIALDANGALYVSDHNNHSIRFISADGQVSTIAGTGTAGFADGAGASAQFDEPMGIALDGQGRLVIADQSNHRIRRLDPAAADHPVTTVAGSGDIARSFTDGAALEGGINPPLAVALSSNGVIYTSFTDLRSISVDGQLGTVAGATAAGIKDGVGDVAGFNMVYGMTVLGDGSLLVADGTRIRIVRRVK